MSRVGVLVEAYRTRGDPAEHKKTAHYQTWHDTVADMIGADLPESQTKVNSAADAARKRRNTCQIARASFREGSSPQK